MSGGAAGASTAAAGPALGLALTGGRDTASWARALSLAVRADDLGLHSVWLPEGHLQVGATPSPVTALCAFAARTRRVRLATTSLLLPLHHPLRVAAETATLDALSGGRALLGLGRGFRPDVFRAFGVEATTKRDRFDAALDALLAAWAGEALPAEGGGPPVHLGLRPLQRPAPPLVVAAFGPKGLLQAARRGLPYLASPLEGLEVLAENYAAWRDACAGPVDPRAPRVPVMRTVFVAADDGAARRVREALEGEAARRVGPRAPKALRRALAGPLADRALVGTASEVADGVARYRERLGLDLLVARTEVPGAAPAERDASLERLAVLLPASGEPPADRNGH